MYLILYCLILALSSFTQSLHSDEKKEDRKKVCLNMIVKNESKVIERCLASVKPIIDYWVIVDTGSTDKTQEIIKNFLKEIPGELHEKSWKNFEHNRNEALMLAKNKADYLLLMDADETLKFDHDFKMPRLTLGCYNSSILLAGCLQYDRPLLIKNSLPWKWEGVLHEYLDCPQRFSSDRLPNMQKIASPDGVRSQDPLKYQKDAQMLEKALNDDPTNSRYVFYLAQSYKDFGDYLSALKNYERRVAMGGWDQEVFYSKLQVARMQELLNEEPKKCVKSYLDAYHYRPTRAEPLYSLAQYYRQLEDYPKAYFVASLGMNIPFSQDSLFVEKWAYDYGLEFECSISAYWMEKYAESQRLCQKLLAKTDLPKLIRKRVEKNLKFSNAKLLEQLGVLNHSP